MLKDSSVTKALLMLALGQSLAFLDFGGNSFIAHMAANFHKSEDANSMNSIKEIIWRGRLLSYLYTACIATVAVLDLQNIDVYLFVLFLVWSIFFNLYINIFRGFQSHWFTIFSTSIPLTLVALIAFNFQGKLYPAQIWPLASMFLVMLYGLIVSKLLKRRFAFLREVNSLKIRFKEFRIRTLIGDRSSIYLWIFNLSMTVFINIDRFYLAVLNKKKLLIEISPYFFVFSGMSAVLLVLALNHSISLMHANHDIKAKYKQLNIVGVGFGLAYPVLTLGYISVTTGIENFQIFLSIGYGLALVFLAVILTKILKDFSEVGFRARIKVALLLTLIHSFLSAYLLIKDSLYFSVISILLSQMFVVFYLSRSRI